MVEFTRDFLVEFGLSAETFRERGLREFAEAAEREVVQRDEDGREHELIPEAGAAWIRMRDAAREDGYEIFIVSAFRSIERQGEIVRGKFMSGMDAERIFALSAPPGFSEHHTGRAVDVSAPGFEPLEEEFEESGAFGWLCEHAGEFGFSLSYPRDNPFGYLYEPWHWCFAEGTVDQSQGGEV